MKKVLLIALIVFACLGIFSTTSKAEEPATGGETTVGTLMLAKPSVDVTLNHEGDVFAAGQSVILKGKIYGNLFVAGSSVTLPKDLEVKGSVFAAGQSVVSEAMVYGQVYLAGSNITDSSEVYGDIKAAGSNVNLAGKYNYAYESGEKLTFAGFANYGLRLAGKTVEITDESTVNGKIKINVSAGNTPKVPEKYKAATEIIQKKDDPDDHPTGLMNIWTLISGFLFSFVVGIVMMYIFPTGFEKIKHYLTKKMWFSLLWGFLSFLIVPICGIVLMLIFFPAAVVFVIAGVFFWIATFLFGSIVIYYWIGELLGKLIAKDKPIHAVLVLLMGLVATTLVLFLISLIPIVGPVSGLIKLAIYMIGSGAVIMAIFTKEPAA